jgi:hypothetical protein
MTKSFSQTHHQPSMDRLRLRKQLLDLSRPYLQELGNYKWAKYLIFLWAARMSLLVVSLLFPILSALSTPQETDIYRFEIPRVNFKEKNIEDLLLKRTPFIINDFSIPLESIGKILDLELSKILPNVKVNQHPNFIHFSPDQSWSILFAPLRTHTVVSMDANEFFDIRSTPDADTFVYLSRQIRDPSSSIIIQALSPNMLLLPLGKGVTPDFRLWLSSKGVTASPHYDMEHNFFVQLNGTKRFILSAPIHYDVFRPFSFLHPCWRQSSRNDLLNVSAIRSSSNFSERKRTKKKSNSPTPTDSMAYCPQESDETSDTSVHEVILHAGQLLYIPPFFYHSVTALDEYSVSLNSWVGSEYVQTAENLRLQIPLPYYPSNEIPIKLSSIGNLIKSIITRLSLPYSYQQIKSDIFDRADPFLEEDLTTLEENCKTIHPFSLCTEETVRMTGKTYVAHHNFDLRIWE